MPRYRIKRPTQWVLGLGGLGVILIVGVRFLGVPGEFLSPLLVVLLFFPALMFRSWYLLLPGVLWVVSGSQGAFAIPLAEAERRPVKGGWAITWRRGRGRLILPDPDGAFLRGLPQRFGEGAPQSEQEARQTYPLGAMAQSPWWALAGLALAFGAQGLVIWLQEPLIYLALLLLPWLARRMTWRRLLVVSGESLWVLEENKEPHPIPLAKVTGVEQGPFVAKLRTGDTNYPVIPVNPFWGSDLIRRVRQRVQRPGE